MSTVLALIPTLPPESSTIRIPASMSPTERERLIDELRAISTEFARIQTREEERAKFLEQRFWAIDVRFAKLENSAEQTGRHDLVTLQKALDKRDAEFSRWRWWALSIVATIVTSAIIGLVVFYLNK
jgi:hypothetical protein